MADSKHLEFLQAVITRMAANSFLAKGWSIAFTTALLGLAVKEGGPYFALIGLLPVLVFAIVDAYYLALEKCFRDRFTVAAQTYVDGNSPDFVMAPDFNRTRFYWAIGRPPVYLVHGPLAVALLAAFGILLCR